MKISSYALIATMAAVSLGGGVVIAKEMEHGRMAPMFDAERFGEIDTDGNGEITKDEMKAHREARFASSDSDGDGKLSVTEIAAQMRAEADRRAERMVARMDTDGDGFLAADEIGRRGPGRGHGDDHGDRAGRFFDRADTDGSGGLTLEELQAIRDRMAEHMGKRRHDDKN